MVTLGGTAMSKSKGNVVDPDGMIKKFGADTTRLFMLFAAPPEKSLEWSEKGAEGANRFLQRIWNLFFKVESILTDSTKDDFQVTDEDSKKIYIKLQQTIKKVGEDIEIRFNLNTGIAALMEFFNDLSAQHEILVDKNPGLLRHCFKILVTLLSPYTPHFCNELWSKMGHGTLIEEEAWPTFDPKFITEETVNIMIQINGKIRDKIVVDLDENEENIKEKALASEKVQQHIQCKQVFKTIYIKNKMFSIVVK